MPKRMLKVYEGEVEIDPYVRYDEDRGGVYIGGERLGLVPHDQYPSLLAGCEGRHIRLTIEVIEEGGGHAQEDDHDL